MSAKDLLVRVFEDIQRQYDWAILEHKYLPKEDILVEDDDENDDVYLIRSGKAAVIVGGGEVVLGEGDLIGEMSFLLSNKRTASIVAKEEVCCWGVSVSSMERIFEQDPPLAARFYKALGGLLAQRLVSSSRRSTQNRIFEDNDDTLIALMKSRSSEICEALNNIVRSQQNELKLLNGEAATSIGRLDADRTIDSAQKRMKISMIELKLKQDQSLLFQKIEPRLKSVFLSLQQLLLEIYDLEKRNEVGANAFEQFQTQFLGRLPFLQKRGTQNIESVDLLLHIFHRHENQDIWDVDKVIMDWLDDLLWNLPTLEAFRTRHDLMADVLLQHLSPDFPEDEEMTLVYDSVGMILTRLLNSMARLKTCVNMVYSDPRTMYQIDYALSGRMGRIAVRNYRVPSVLSLVLGDSPLLPDTVAPKSQRFIVFNGLMNYLPDRYLAELLHRAKAVLASDGMIFISGILPTTDQALFTDFFKWPMIRRNEKDIVTMLKALGFSAQIHTRNGGIVVQASQM